MVTLVEPTPRAPWQDAHFVGGHPVLDLTNTVFHRSNPVQDNELLKSPADVLVVPLLDSSAARDLEESLSLVLKGRTVIAIAHQLTAARNADRIACHGRRPDHRIGKPR